MIGLVRKISGRLGALSLAMGVMMVGAMALAGASSATPADPVSDAFTTLQDKVTLYGAAVVTLVVAVVVLFFGIKFLRRGANKA